MWVISTLTCKYPEPPSKGYRRVPQLRAQIEGPYTYPEDWHVLLAQICSGGEHSKAPEILPGKTSATKMLLDMGD